MRSRCTRAAAASLSLLITAVLWDCSGRPPAASTGRRTGDTRLDSVALLAGAVVDAPSLRDVVASRALVGRRVRLTGRCLSPARSGALRGPPDARGFWQLEADGVTVFVTGPAPGMCLAPGESDTVTITARVAEDTLPAIDDLPPAPRRYLVRLEERQE